MRITVKREEKTGRWSGQRAAKICIDGERVGSIFPAAAHQGWCFQVGSEPYGLDRKNTSESPLGTYEEAKAAALAHVKKLAKRVPQFRVQVDITGVLITTVYAADLAAATEKGRDSVRRVVASLSGAIEWNELGDARVVELPAGGQGGTHG